MLDALLKPKSIAVVGASRTPGKVGYEILSNLKANGFAGDLTPVNPTADEILGLRCAPSCAAIGRPLDLAVIAVPTKVVQDAVDDAIAAGVGALVVITAGFKEVGPDGASRERQLAERCHRRNVRLLGPNCLGLINAHHDMNASFAKHMPCRGGISVLSQSGALLTAILDWAAERKLGLSKLISMGNKADLSETDFLEALADDPDTNVIVGYLESVAAGDTFIKAAESAASRKPVVLFKAGVTAAGGRAASSHTGSLAGADVGYAAAFRRAGIVRAETFETLFDIATAFDMQPLPRGDRIAVLTNAGGPGIMAADAIELSGLKMAVISEATAAELRPALPAAASVNNPVDVLGDADAARYGVALEGILKDDGVDAVVVILTPQAMTDAVATAGAIQAAAANSGKPVLVSFMGGDDVREGRRALGAARLPDYPAPERAVAAVHAMCEYSAWLRRPPRMVTRFPVNHRRVERIIQRHLRTGELQVGEAAAKEIIQAYDFHIPAGALAGSADEAVEVAERIGFPVAMKIASPDIIHKSDLGGVKLQLNSAEAVRDTYDLMMMRIGQRVPTARLGDVYVEQMCGRGREVILGMTRDPQFGPMLMFGLGGIFVEVMKDVAFHLAPITQDEAMQMLESTKSFGLLRGVRGQRSVDVQAIAEALQRISQLATDFPQVSEMDINPFIVAEVGRESVAADARITLIRK
jgi:acetate---CoA ligase (ADP-forming)